MLSSLGFVVVFNGGFGFPMVSTMASTYDPATWPGAGGSVEGADGLAPRVLSAFGPVLRQEPEADAAWLRG